MDIVEMFSTETIDEGVVTEVIRPAAVLPERAAFDVLRELSERDARLGGLWISQPTLWQRYDRPWQDRLSAGDSQLLGSLQVAYGMPSRYEITIYRVTLTIQGLALGWTVGSLCDEALGFGGHCLATCPRADLNPSPRPFLC